MADFFESCAGIFDDYKKICNWLNGSVLQAINERKTTIAQLDISPEKLTDLIKKVDDGTISNLVAKDVFLKMLDSGKDASAIIEEEGLAQVSDEGELEGIVDALVTDNPQVVEQIQSGQEKAIGFLVGQAMKKTQGKANPKMIRELITRRLSNG